MSTHVETILQHSQAIMESIKLVNSNSVNTETKKVANSFKSQHRQVSQAITKCRQQNNAQNIYHLARAIHQLCHFFKLYEAKHAEYEIYEDKLYSQYAIFKWLSSRVKLDFQPLDIISFTNSAKKSSCC